MRKTFVEDLAKTADDPNDFSRLVFGTPLHEGQNRYARNATADVNFCLPGNSWGKTEFICRFACWLAWHKKGPYRPTNFAEWIAQEYKALIASYNYPIARESFDRLMSHLRNREELQVLIAKTTTKDPARVEFTNGAVIDWGSLDQDGKLVEAARRRAILVDEAGHIPDLSYTFDSILFPRTMGVGGRIHLLGTPKPHSDPYLLEIYEKGRSGDPFYYSQDGSVLENEFWPEEEKDRVFKNPRYVRGWTECPTGGLACPHPACRPEGHPILTNMGKQVILGMFLLAEGYFFNRLHINRLFSEGREVTWHGEDFFAEEPQEGRRYLAAFDLAGNKPRKRKKKGSDPTVGLVLDVTEKPWHIVRYDFIEGGSADWQQKYDVMEEVYRNYRLPYLIIDGTGQVDSVQEALENRGIEVEGKQFGGTRKFDMLRNLQLAMEMDWNGNRGLIRSPLIPKLKHELDHYVLPDDDLEQDIVMTLAMVVHEAMMSELPDAIFGPVI